MIVSDYTFLFDYKDKYYAYNALTNSLLEFELGLYKKLEDAYCNHKEVKLDDEDNDTIQDLKVNRIITNNQKDEYLLYKSMIMAQRAERYSMHLTIAPTMECCFNCHYCFEKYKEPGVMSEETMDAIIKYVTSYKELKSLKLTWFGGEPLMAIEQMRDFYKKLEPHLDNINFSSNIITSGYHIDKRTIDILENIKVTHMQITLDGNKECHLLQRPICGKHHETV